MGNSVWSLGGKVFKDAVLKFSLGGLGLKHTW